MKSFVSPDEFVWENPGSVKLSHFNLVDIEDESWESVLNPKCHEDNSGLRRTLFAAVLWLAVAIIAWGVLLVWKCGEKIEDEEEDSSEEEDENLIFNDDDDENDGGYRKTE